MQAQARCTVLKCPRGSVVLSSCYNQHLAGKRYMKFVREDEARLEAEERETLVAEEEISEIGPTCRKSIPDASMAEHLEEHLRKIRIQEELAQTEENKEGIIVDMSEGVDFGVVEVGHSEHISVNITKTEGKGRIVLVSYSMLSRHLFLGQSRRICSKKLRSIVITFNPSIEGYYEDILELVFAHPGPNGKQIIITRRVHRVGGSREDQELLKPKAPHVKRKCVPLSLVTSIIPSLRPPIWSRTIWVKALPKFDPPQYLITAAYQKKTSNSMAAVKSLIPSVLDINTYSDYFQALLFIEDLEHFTMSDEELTPEYPRYNLKVKGLLDGRPNVLVGDYILVRRTGDSQDSAWYEGRVHSIVNYNISLYFNHGFSNYRGNKYDVRFVYNRVPERRMHQALTNNFKPARLLFPDETHISYTPVTTEEIGDITPINWALATNPQQLQTVAAILKQPPGSVPFVIFGPPDVRILACAPSNAGADIIAMKLRGLGASQLFRLNSSSRKPKDFPQELSPFSLLNGNDYRVIVATCFTAADLWGVGFKKGHFTHIFIDEAGQGEEPQVIAPIKSLGGNSTNLVLAGDHKQLGPIVGLLVARAYKLSTSYLLRLMEREIYDVKYGQGLTVVKLLRNFTSHPKILEVSNTNFYNSELQPCGDPAVTHSLEDCEELPTKKFPIIFHGIIGRVQREGSWPLFFNIDEASLVKKYCSSLLSNRKKGTKAKHIGVITPYSLQKSKIIDLFHRDPKLRNIKVGTVDEFEGQERRVIILSAVRSAPDHVTLDLKHSLGFVSMSLRLNVAITRAQALLIVIGNPVVLSLDPLWRSFLNYIHNNGGWLGANIAWDPNEPVETSDYDEKYWQQADIELEDTMRRLRAVISQNLEQFDLNIDSGDDEDNMGVNERVVGRDGE
ncbi:hypothetical protein AMATHDRAFT_77900 [Amanita thiersii Skay4041]|uniref:RNA helicase n=1 Tax=Amanita thiersii Skay4041 TaxID=703135 RepID=A0A2A9NDT0_9AGAR|nr:hypothetical protein AMATHDRAFT_77900 [Amanita thiersii Skay4041]